MLLLKMTVLSALVLNEHGEFLNAAEGNEVLRIAAAEEFEFADIEHIGKYRVGSPPTMYGC